MNNQTPTGRDFAMLMLYNCIGEQRGRVHIQRVSKYAENFVEANNLSMKGRSRRTVERRLNELARAGLVQTNGKGLYWA